MNAPEAPRLDPRRSAELLAELQARARAWIPSWGLADAEGDFGRALLQVAARFSSEVAERLDGAGDKMRRGFLDWLAVRGEAARPARMPVVFKLTDAAPAAVAAEAPVRLQADAAGTSVIFETEEDVRVVPGRLDVIVGVDADNDAFYLAPPGLSDLQPLEAAPVRWQLKTFAAAGATTLQLDPEGGLAEGTIIEAGGAQYRVVKADKDLVTIEPPLEAELSKDAVVSKVTTFIPFGSTARDWQAHALYLGDAELLNIEGAATIEVVGASALRDGVAWQYWGKAGGTDEVAWQSFDLAPAAQQNASKGVVLTKDKGSIDVREIAGRSGRWIRAYKPTSTGAIRPDEFSIRINAGGCAPGAMKCPPDAKAVSPAADGMANTTPLVLQNVFFPLGKEPRQFDAFYLGSKEVFSKPHAKVQLCFEMADPNFSALASLRAESTGDQVLAGVAADGHLHLLQFQLSTGRLTRYAGRDPLRPPSPDATGAAAPGTPVPLDPHPDYRPAMWGTPTDFFVAVSAGNTVWMWHEDGAAPAHSGWTPLGPVETNPAATTRTDALVYLASGTAGQLFALRDSKLFARDPNDPNATWAFVETQDATGVVDLEQIAPIAVETQNLAGDLNEGLVAIDDFGTLFLVQFAGTPLAGTCTELFDQVETTVAPAAIRRSDGSLIAVAISDDASDRRLLGLLSAFTDVMDEAALDWPDTGTLELVGDSIDLNICGGQLTFVVSLRSGDASAVVAWAPQFSTTEDTVAYISEIPVVAGTANGAPTLLPQHIVVPTSGEVVVAAFDPSLRTPLSTALETVVVTEAAEDRLAAGDSVAFLVDNAGTDEYHLEKLPDAGITYRGRTYHAFAAPTVDDDLLVYKASSEVFDSTFDSAHPTELTLDTDDELTGADSVLLVTTDNPPKLYVVDHMNMAGTIATLKAPLVFANPAHTAITYQVPDPSAAIVRPMMRLDAANRNWDPSVLDRVRIQFPGADPEFQAGAAFQLNGGHPELIALEAPWVTAPTLVSGSFQFLIDASVGAWARQLGDSSTNPELSWEYWNGTGWWTLGLVLDDTLNLKQTGAVTFTVPSDLGETDWSGQVNHWIRARLIGGDYGQEKVIVTSKTLTDGSTEQTVQRSTDGIRAPSVLKLHISYALCDGTRPTFVLAEDSGSTRDQSDANRTPGAIVEAFVPVSVTLGGLSGDRPAETAEAKVEDCPPECHCNGQPSSGATVPAPPPSQPGLAAPAATGRWVLVGLDAALSEAPVNVLFLVAERDHTAFAPLATTALMADRFQPLVARDGTRSLGETGVLSMAFPIQPAPRELFGRTLTWLRLGPHAGGTGAGWEPAVHGAYFNAVWASATETLTRELLGSSEGAPNFTLRVQRPPILHDTLELRVRERLGEEERAELLETNPRRVVSDVDENLRGDWVLWDRVIDPLDESPQRRGYALDEGIGEVRFGDGLHGMIPPIGRDSIVAFSYKRTEPGAPGSDTVPANAIAARTPLNLVSPVESVEAVFAADQAAGGAPPESVDRVLRFGSARLRHRGRAVTARDIEDLALQSSPHIVQARAIRVRDHVRLVVVMKGRNPLPSAPELRELRRLLLQAAPASFGPKALRLAGPSIRRLRIDVRVRTETLDNAGALAREVKKRFGAFFDTATGGTEQQGWPLGLNPGEEDIALALIDTPFLESLASVALRETFATGDDRPWPAALRPAELALLADDPVRIEFETAEVTA